MENYKFSYESNNSSSENSDSEYVENKNNKNYQKNLRLYKIQSHKLRKKTFIDYLHGNQEDEYFQDDPFNYKKLFFSDLKENSINKFIESYGKKTFEIEKINQTNEEINKFYENKISKLNKNLLNNEENLIKLSNQIETNEKLEKLNNLQSEFLVDDYLNQLKLPKKKDNMEFNFPSKNFIEKSFIPHRFDNLLIKNDNNDIYNSNNSFYEKNKDFNNYEIKENKITLIESEEEEKNNDNNKDIKKKSSLINSNSKNEIKNLQQKKSIFIKRFSKIEENDILDLKINKEIKKRKEKKNKKIDENGIISLDPRFNFDLNKIKLDLRENLKNEDGINFLKFIDYSNNKVIFLEAIDLIKNEDLENDMELYEFLSPINLQSLEKRSQILIESKLKPMESVLKRLFRILINVKKNISQKKIKNEEIEKSRKKSLMRTMSVKGKYDFVPNQITEGTEEELDSFYSQSMNKQIDTEQSKKEDFSFDKFNNKGNYSKNEIGGSRKSFNKVDNNIKENKELNKEVIVNYKSKLKNYFGKKKDKGSIEDKNKEKENSEIFQKRESRNLINENTFDNDNISDKTGNEIFYSKDEKNENNETVSFIPRNLNVNALKSFINYEMNKQANKK